MRMRSLLLSSSVVVACVLAAAACSDSSDPVIGAGDASSDAPVSLVDASGGGDSSLAEDAGADADEPGTVATEVEPNGGVPPSAVGAMALPGTMNGAIDPANDTDIFAIKLAPGDFWDWTATPKNADLAPHVIIFDTAGGKNPIVAGFAGAGAAARLQHFVVNSGTFVVGVRDARNVGADGGKGGAGYGYALVAKRSTPKPIAVTFPATKTGKLASVGSVDLYTFTGTGGKGWDIIVRAARKTPASSLDARLTLFDLTAKKHVITNDNGPATNDPQVGSDDAAPSAYMVVVENEGLDASDLSYEIDFKLR